MADDPIRVNGAMPPYVIFTLRRQKANENFQQVFLVHKVIAFQPFFVEKVHPHDSQGRQLLQAVCGLDLVE